MANIHITPLKHDDQELKQLTNSDMRAVIGGQAVLEFKGIEFIYSNGKIVGYYDHDEGTCNAL
ncbi:MAG TPA: hypothetical protein V6C65_24170 [Allocoleopsis sp.]